MLILCRRPWEAIVIDPPDPRDLMERVRRYGEAVRRGDGPAADQELDYIEGRLGILSRPIRVVLTEVRSHKSGARIGVEAHPTFSVLRQELLPAPPKGDLT